MKTYKFYRWVVENGARVYKEFAFTAATWTQARRMMSDTIRGTQ
jgi:hypothetical protein